MHISGVIHVGDDTEGQKELTVVIPDQDLPGLTSENQELFGDVLRNTMEILLPFLHWSLGTQDLTEMTPTLLSEFCARLQDLETGEGSLSHADATTQVETEWVGRIPLLRRVSPITATPDGLFVVGELATAAA